MGDTDDTAHRDDASDVDKPEGERRRAFDRAIPDLLKRAVEKAVETGVGRLSELSDGPDGLRNFVGDMKLPKEVLHYLYQQIDDTKAGLYRVVAKEIRDVLEQVDRRKGTADDPNSALPLNSRNGDIRRFAHQPPRSASR